jgi:hypothetical protein
MVPLDRFRTLAGRQFHPGQEYVLVNWRGRSEKSHAHYFACIKTGWDNLREDIAGRFPSPEYLRKWCLVKEGYADETNVVVDDEEQAAKLALVIRKMDPYAVIRIQEAVVTIWRAQSQDHASMGWDAFQESKTKVLERIALMCGLTLKELTKHTPKVIEHGPKETRLVGPPAAAEPPVGDF